MKEQKHNFYCDIFLQIYWNPDCCISKLYLFSPLLQNVDFLWDNAECLQHGFTIEPCKGIFEPGGKETISITWKPTSDFMVKSR